MPSGAIPTQNNNNPDLKNQNNVNDSNADCIDTDCNNSDNLRKLQLFLKTKLGTKF